MGEAFIELLLCRQVVAGIEAGAHPQLAVETAVRTLGERRGAVGGLIAVDRHGRIGAAHNGSALLVAAFADDEPCPVMPVPIA